MLVTPLPIVTLLSRWQSLNAPTPTLATLLGMVMLVRPGRPENAPAPMLVTGRPVIVLGMVTAPPEPVYTVMVIVPLMVVQVQGPRTAGRPPKVLPQPVVPCQ